MKSTETVVPKEDSGAPLEFDPDFKGPIKNRSCTDIICLFLFVAFLAGWFVVAFFAFRQGDPRILVYPSDTQGNICGIGKFEDKKYLFFFDILKCASPKVIRTGCLTPQVCVEKCPNDTFYATASLPEIDKSKLICQYQINTANKTLMQLADGEQCAAYYLPSSPISKTSMFAENLPPDILLDRCIPNRFLKKGNDVVSGDNNQPVEANGEKVTEERIQKAVKYLARFLSFKEAGEQIFADFKTAWTWILLFLFIAMFISLLWIYLMRWIAGIMVWLSIGLVLTFCGAGCYFSAKKYYDLKQVNSSNTTVEFTTNLNSYLGFRDTWLAFAIITGLIFVIFLLILIFLRKRIVVAVALIKEGSRAVSSMMTTLLFPILPYFLQLCFFVFALVVALYIASSGQASFVIADAPEGSDIKNGSICNPKNYNITKLPGIKCIFRDFGVKNNIYSAHAYNGFGLFWGVFFAIGLGQVTLAGAFAAYYWTFDKSRDLPTFGLSLGCYRCLRFHLGSVALGSLIIAIVRMIRVMLEYIDQKCKKYDNAVTKAIMCCMKCCFWLLEKVLRFITKNAYIMIAVYGENFCSSGKRAVKLLWRNVVRTVVIDKVTDFLLLMGKLVVLSISAAIAFYFFTWGDPRLQKYVPTLHFNVIPPLFVTFGSYIIASGFFSVYGMAVDTLFLCFLEDCERNDGSKEKPYYMSKELMLILDKKNKFRNK